jgi:hypothetical protein
MVKCKVEFFGLPDGTTDLGNIEIELEKGTGLSDLVAGLKQKIPALEGSIIVPHENKLTRYYVFNINGRFHMNDSKVQILSTDHIILLTFPLGG